MIHASLFSGIGGPEVAAAMLGWDNAFHCEINPFGKAVLEYWFPNSKSYDDITKASFKEWRGRIDVLTGGFPCQPFSYAGKRGGRNDDRYLWPEMLRVIDEVRPAWVVGENVAGITTMVEGGVLSDMGCDPVMFGEGDGLHRYQLRERFTIERICSDLEGLGYSVQPLLVPAAAVGAPHRRDRVFIVAHDADADGGDAVRGPGVVPRERGTERIQERDKVREPGVAGGLRSEVQGSTEDSDDASSVVGVHEVERSQRDIRDTRAGDSQRICGEAGTAASHPGRRTGEGKREMERELPGRNGSGGDGCKRTTTDTHGEGREEPVIAGRPAYPAEDGARLHDRAERPRRNGNAADSVFPRLERQDESRTSEGGERMRLWGDTPRYDWQSLSPNQRWAGFPTISPVHRGNDGIPIGLDDLSISFSKWRTESLKAYGNAIVPQVMYRIFQAIEAAQ